MPSVPRPSLTAASNATSRWIAALNSLDRARDRWVDAELGRELLQRVGLRAGDAGAVVLLLAQHRADARVEQLEGDAAGLGEDLAAELGVGVVAVVLALVDEPAAVAVDHDPERIAAAGVLVGQLAVSPAGVGLGVPGDAVAGRPVAVRRGAGVERGLQHLAGVERVPAHQRPSPSGAEVPLAQLGARLEAAGREDHRVGLQRAVAEPHAVVEEAGDRRAVLDPDPRLPGRGGVLGDQALAAVHRAEREPAPEQEPAVALVGLPLVHQPPPDAALGEPLHHRAAVGDQELGHRRVVARGGQALHVPAVVLGRVRREIGDRQALVGLDQLADRVDPAVRDPERPRRVEGVAARGLLGRLLEDRHARAALGGGVRGAEPGVAAADDDQLGGHRSTQRVASS